MFVFSVARHVEVTHTGTTAAYCYLQALAKRKPGTGLTQADLEEVGDAAGLSMTLMPRSCRCSLDDRVTCWRTGVCMTPPHLSAGSKELVIPRTMHKDSSSDRVM